MRVVLADEPDLRDVEEAGDAGEDAGDDVDGDRDPTTESPETRAARRLPPTA